MGRSFFGAALMSGRRFAAGSRNAQGIQAMDDHRTAARQRTLKGGKICFAQAATIDCTIKNLSPDGACLEFAGPMGIPDRFDLILNSDQTSRPCRVMWRAGRRLGVSFL